MHNEEHELKMMLGIPLPKFNGREGGIGGGGHTEFRKELSLNKLEGNLISSGQKIVGSQILKNSGSTKSQPMLAITQSGSANIEDPYHLDQSFRPSP